MGFSTSRIETFRDLLLPQIKNKEFANPLNVYTDYVKLTYNKKDLRSFTFIALAIYHFYDLRYCCYFLVVLI